MQIIILILSIIIFIKTLSYGIYEFKNKNKNGGICVIILSIMSLVLPSVTVIIRGE